MRMIIPIGDVEKAYEVIPTFDNHGNLLSAIFEEDIPKTGTLTIRYAGQTLVYNYVRSVKDKTVYFQ